MRFVIITHVPHKLSNGRLSAYGPYVREMNIWGKCVDEIEIVAPFQQGFPNAIDLEYDHKKIVFRKIPGFDVLSAAAKIGLLFKLPIIVWNLVKAMRKADHIHLRCPGNIGLIGCFIQMFFPKTPKTAKYAGNWDPKSKQPMSYRLQKWLLNNTFLTRNMAVLVYGEWEGSSANIRPFFTATYKEEEKDALTDRTPGDTLRLLFVGTLSPGKQPLYAIKIAQELHRLGLKCQLEFYGEGSLRSEMEAYITQHHLSAFVRLMGNQHEKTVRGAYKTAHFVLLPSKSEGWPKVVAEAMFWGCVPVATPVSCVPYMMGNGSRGVLLTMDAAFDTEAIVHLFRDSARFRSMSGQAAQWSRQYTLDVFGRSVAQLLQNPVNKA